VAAALEECVDAAEEEVAPRPARPPSPCINVCSLDAHGLCTGCLRTGDEIARWLAMSAAEQWRLLELLKERRRLNQQVT
jgi:predicted Fe-S protein YdhL (DUF1289 family)